MDISFVSADKKKTYCLYEAPNPEAIREAARKLNPGRDYRLGRVADTLRHFRMFHANARPNWSVGRGRS